MANILEILAWTRKAKRAATASSKTLAQIFDDLNDAILSPGVISGQVLISSSEANGSFSFTFPPGHTPLDLVRLNEEAILYCSTCPDPENPILSLPKRIKRLRVSFGDATI
jgi:hypothetical protein